MCWFSRGRSPGRAGLRVNVHGARSSGSGESSVLAATVGPGPSRSSALGTSRPEVSCSQKRPQPSASGPRQDARSQRLRRRELGAPRTRRGASARAGVFPNWSTLGAARQQAHAQFITVGTVRGALPGRRLRRASWLLWPTSTPRGTLTRRASSSVDALSPRGGREPDVAGSSNLGHHIPWRRACIAYTFNPGERAPCTGSRKKSRFYGPSPRNLLRGDYTARSEYGRVILPFTVLSPAGPGAFRPPRDNSAGSRLPVRRQPQSAAEQMSKASGQGFCKDRSSKLEPAGPAGAPNEIANRSNCLPLRASRPTPGHRRALFRSTSRMERLDRGEPPVP